MSLHAHFARAQRKSITATTTLQRLQTHKHTHTHHKPHRRYRIQCLRSFLSAAMEGGEAALLALVQRVAKRAPAGAAGEEGAAEALCASLGDAMEERSRPLLCLVLQLVVAQREAYGDAKW